MAVQILKKSGILNIQEQKHTKRNSQKKFGTKKIFAGCQTRRFYPFLFNSFSNSRLLKSGNEFGIAYELSKSQKCDGLFFNINLINFF